jgi:hypothetical protein
MRRKKRYAIEEWWRLVEASREMLA